MKLADGLSASTPASELVVHLSAADLVRWDEHYDKTAKPIARKMRRLIVQYAYDQGGLTLEYWRRSNGQWFGEPVMMGAAAIAKELKVPLSEVEKVRVATWEWLNPQLAGDPELDRIRNGAAE